MGIVSYLQCQGCELIHDSGKLPRTAAAQDLLTLVAYCPECGSDQFEEVKGVCDRCETAFAVKGDDYCAPCALLIDAQDEADFHADNAIEPGFYDDERHEVVVRVEDHLERRIA